MSKQVRTIITVQKAHPISPQSQHKVLQFLRVSNLPQLTRVTDSNLT